MQNTLKIWKLWRAATILQFKFFFWYFAHVFYLQVSTKRCVGFFSVLFRSWVICKNQKGPGFYTLIFYSFINNLRSTQNKTNPTHPLVDITK